MTKQLRQIKFEHFLYALAFVLALGIRVLNLGKVPLSDYEAGWALQSWHAVQGDLVDIGPNPAYFSLTTLVVYLLESSNALARFWPAVVGSLIVLLPYGFRRWLGCEPALIMAFGLALDPGMVAISRLAGGPMLAIGFSGLALVFLYAGKPAWAGIFGGLGLISGPSVFGGLVGFLIAYGVARLAGLTPSWAEEPTSYPGESSKAGLRTGLIYSAVTILLASTLFLRFPNGLGALGSSLMEYLRGWIDPSPVPAFQPILAVIFYQPLALVFGVVAAVHGWLRGDLKARWLSLWVLVILIITLFYPGRMVSDAAWAMIPLWALAAFELARHLKISQNPLESFGQAAIIFVLGVLFWLTSLNPVQGNLTWLILVVVPVLGVLTIVLVGLGWSWDAARCGGMWGLGLILGVFVLAALFGVSQVRPNSARELWSPSPGTVQAGLLEQTLGELAIVQNGRDDWIEIVSLVQAPSLQWTLRNYANVSYVSTLNPEILASVIITPGDSSDLSQTMAYRGQDFVWAEYPDWSGPLPPQWWQWVTTRQAPIRHENIVLWARSDLFPEQPVQGNDVPGLAPSENDEGSPSEESIE
jgi:hypothetical protein